MKHVTGITPFLPSLAEFAVDVDWYHQLGVVGGFRIAPDTTNRLEVGVDFRTKAINGIKGPLEPRARFWTNLSQVHSLIAGSLWRPSGYLASDGRAVRGRIAPDEPAVDHPVLADSCTFSLGASPSYLAQVGTLFPSPKFELSLLGAHREAWVLVREEAAQRIIIPCFELLRTFYYVDGLKLVHFFFSHEPLASVCHVLEQPTEANGGKARVAFVTDGFTDLQYCTLAELALNPAFDLARQQTHGALLGTAIKRPTGTYPRVDFQLGRDIRVDATGFSFTAGNEKHFWVCAIRSHAPIWSFLHLEFDTALDHRGNSSSANPTPVAPAAGPLDRIRAPALPLVTGELLGSSRTDTIEGESVLEASSALPQMTQVPKEARPERYAGQRGYFDRIPSFFTYEGGLDENVYVRQPAKISQLKGATPPPLSLPAFFEEVVAWLASLEGFKVMVLTVNNNDTENKPRVSFLPHFRREDSETFLTSTPRPIAIAHIQLGQNHFYFFQLLDGGRAALIFYKGFGVLGETKINLLLNQLAVDGCNWDRVRKTYKRNGSSRQRFEKEVGEGVIDEEERRNSEKDGIDQLFRDRMGLGLEIRLRNHTLTPQGTPSAAARSEQELRQLVLLKLRI